jgi:hypothetical protein
MLLVENFCGCSEQCKEKRRRRGFMEDGGEEKMIGGWRNRSAVLVGQKLVASQWSLTANHGRVRFH